jgi:tellurium resistance protein TerZ
VTITLQKGQGLSLAKNSGLSKVTMGLGWDAAKPASSGFFGRLFGGAATPDSIDLDASVIVFDARRKAIDTIWFRNAEGQGGAIRHGGDNLTGDGDGDDEVIHVDLSRLPAEAVSLVFTVNSFRGQTFNEVDNAVCRLLDQVSGEELCRFTLSEQGSHTGVIMAILSRASGTWEMRAVGKAANGRTVSDMIAPASTIL